MNKKNIVVWPNLSCTLLHILQGHLLGSKWSIFNQVIATFVLSRILHLNILQNKWITECIIIVKYCKDFHNLLFLSHKVSFVLCDFLMWFSSKALLFVANLQDSHCNFFSWYDQKTHGRRSSLAILNVYYGAIENIYEDRILKTDKFWTFHITGNLFKKWSKNNYLLYTCI